VGPVGGVVSATTVGVGADVAGAGVFGMGALVVRVVGIANDVAGVSAGAIDTQPTANAPTTKHDSSDRNTSRILIPLVERADPIRAQPQAAVN
jgi:hypothetical protein